MCIDRSVDKTGCGTRRSGPIQMTLCLEQEKLEVKNILDVIYI